MADNNHMMSRVICPFSMGLDIINKQDVWIKCESVYGPYGKRFSYTGLRFPSMELTKNHIYEFCEKSYRYCPVYQMLMHCKYTDDDEQASQW